MTHYTGPKAIPMAGKRIGDIEVLEQDESGHRGARWLCICLACKSQFSVRGTRLRQAEQGNDRAIRCPGCDDGTPRR